jgi:uncharacterized membrane protein YkvA (DUF1232 family)
MTGVNMWWQLLIGLVGGLALLWLALIALLWHANRSIPTQVSSRKALRLLPDVVRLLRSLAADRRLPRGVRVRLGLLLAYLLLPIDLVPDFIPVVGYADDAIIVALALRSIIRRAGREALTRHWPGTTANLHIIEQLAGITTLAR